MRFSLLGVSLLAIAVQATAAQRPQLASISTISGVVYDSIARAPLAHATVQLVSADTAAAAARTTFSDSLGRFTLSDVPAGRYRIGFFHPVLDSLGLEPPVRAVTADALGAVHVDLSTPSPRRLRETICGVTPAKDSAAVFIGVVLSSRDREVIPAARVSAEWVEFTLSQQGMTRNVRSLLATSRGNGWFVICNVPAGAPIVVTAMHGTDSSGTLELQVPTEGFLRRVLYLGAMSGLRLTGMVVNGRGGPVPDAQVSVIGGPETRANERGEWTLTDVPGGTRMLNVRAVSYYPENRAVDVVPDAPPAHIVLSSFAAVLDTVHVRAAGGPRQADLTGFQERRRMGLGHFITSEDVAREHPFVTTQLFRMIPGVDVKRVQMIDSILVRGAVGGDWCVPAVFVNNHYFRNLTADDIDDIVNPKDIIGVEVYTGISTPPQFQPSLTGCGAVVIWTKLGESKNNVTKWGAMIGIATFAAGVGLAALLIRQR